MRAQDLFLEAARQVQPDVYGIVGNREGERIKAATEALRTRARDLLDMCFEDYPDESTTGETRAPSIVHDFDEVKDGEYTFTGQIIRNVRPDGSSLRNPQREEVKRWVNVEGPAGHEYNFFVPVGFVVKRNVVVGVHDLRFSPDDQENWGETQYTQSLDTVTQLFAVPTDPNRAAEAIDPEFSDPFTGMEPIYERLNDRFPVFNNSSERRSRLYTGWLPDEPHRYQTPQAYIEGLNSSLDFLAEALDSRS